MCKPMIRSAVSLYPTPQVLLNLIVLLDSIGWMHLACTIPNGR
jgi:hypothetical protein